MIDTIITLFESGGAELLLIGLSVYAIVYLARHIKSNDILHREDVSGLLKDSKIERNEFRSSIEKISENTTDAIEKLNTSVVELKTVVKVIEKDINRK
jgi:hypothetical protein